MQSKGGRNTLREISDILEKDDALQHFEDEFDNLRDDQDLLLNDIED